MHTGARMGGPLDPISLYSVTDFSLTDSFLTDSFLTKLSRWNTTNSPTFLHARRE